MKKSCNTKRCQISYRKSSRKGGRLIASKGMKKEKVCCHVAMSPGQRPANFPSQGWDQFIVLSLTGASHELVEWSAGRCGHNDHLCRRSPDVLRLITWAALELLATDWWDQKVFLTELVTRVSSGIRITFPDWMTLGHKWFNSCRLDLSGRLLLAGDCIFMQGGFIAEFSSSFSLPLDCDMV